MEVFKSSTPLSIFLLLLFYTTHIPLLKSMATQIYKPKHLSFNLINSKNIVPKHNTLFYQKYNDDVQIHLSSNLPLVMVNFTIGNPPIPQLAIFDTSSNVIWVAQRNCGGCEIKTVPLFDPLESKTYNEIHCTEETCINLGGPADPAKCDASKLCRYKARLASEVVLCEGVVAKDEFSFATYDNGTRRVPNSTFVICDRIRDIVGMKNNGYSGIFGLGFFSRSLVEDLGSKFSYCISDLSDPDHNYSQLNFGEDIVELKGDVAHLEVNQGGIYSVYLERVIIGGEIILSINPHRAILDTGTPVMWWAENYLTIIKSRLRSILLAIGREEVFDSKFSRDRLCFGGDIYKDLIGFPQVLLQFQGGGYMALNPQNLFVQEGRSLFCLVMEQSIDKQSSIIGLVAQQNHFLAYDLEESKMYVQRSTCVN